MEELAVKPPVSKTSVLHAGFEIGILLKGIYAVFEVVSGVLLWLVKPTTVTSWVQRLTESELIEDPNDLLANLIVRLSGHYTVGSQQFGVYYLLSHGLVKIVLVTLLWRKKLWAYPVAIIVLALFIGYQVMRWTSTRSPFLLMISAFDAAMIWLTFVEYRRLRATRDAADGGA
jgi:uncharacterized membrane protein